MKTKVIHIITKMELGGAQQNTLFTVSHLNSERFETFLLAGPGGDLFEEAAELRNFSVVPDLIREVRPLRDLRAILQIRAILKRIKRSAPAAAPVIVHTHSSKAGILGRWAACLAGVPNIIHSVHGFGFNPYQPAAVRNFYIFLEKLTARITRRFVAVSAANLESGCALGIFRRKDVRLIRSGIDIGSFQAPETPRAEKRSALGIPATAPLVTMIACLKPQKAPLDFVWACALVHRDIPEARFLLVGDGELHPEVAAEVGRRGLADRFFMLGWRRDVADLLHASDVMALTSLWEGLPRVLPQAMAAGVPAVVTRVDGSPEAVADGVNGFLVEPGDVKGVAERLCVLLQQPAKAMAMGRRGVERVAEFDIFKMVTDQESLYSELLGGE